MSGSKLTADESNELRKTITYMYDKVYNKSASFTIANIVSQNKEKYQYETVRRLVKQYETIGNLNRKRKTGRPASKLTRKTICKVRRQIRTNANISVRTQAYKLEISPTTVQRIRKDVLGIQVSKCPKIPNYKDEDQEEDSKRKAGKLMIDSRANL